MHGRLFICELLFDELREHVDSGVVMTSLRHNDICKTLTWLDELLVHGFEHFLVSLNHLLRRTSALYHVTLHHTNQALIAAP